MAIDLTGGLPAAREHLLAECPTDPEVHDSVSFWVFDDRGEVALPRVGIEAVGSHWSHHGVQANVAFPDGTVYRLRADAPSMSPIGADGQPSVLGAGPLTFRCIEPFTRWTMEFEGDMVRTSTEQLVSGDIDGPTVPVRFDVTATMAVPPWVQGALNRTAQQLLAATEEGALMGGPRYEQLFRATGSVTVDGRTHPFAGGGLRIRRVGVRRLAEFRGHAWQTAIFPSGRAFGYMAYPPREDGAATFNEGFVFLGDGDLVAATVVKAPWLTEIAPVGQDVSLTLQTERGLIEIEGETVIATFDVHHKDKTLDMAALHNEHADFPALHQAAVRYSWDGEVTYGMIERSNPIGKITIRP